MWAAPTAKYSGEMLNVLDLELGVKPLEFAATCPDYRNPKYKV